MTETRVERMQGKKSRSAVSDAGGGVVTVLAFAVRKVAH